jgi:hypothetical protein
MFKLMDYILPDWLSGDRASGSREPVLVETSASRFSPHACEQAEKGLVCTCAYRLS